jgi:hypothetical protein
VSGVYNQNEARDLWIHSSSYLTTTDRNLKHEMRPIDISSLRSSVNSQLISPLLPDDLLQYLVEGIDRAGQAEVDAVGRHPRLRAAVRERVAVHVKPGVAVGPHDRQLRHVQHLHPACAAAMPGPRRLHLLVDEADQLHVEVAWFLLPLLVRLLPRAHGGEGVALEVARREGGDDHGPCPAAVGARDQPVQRHPVRHLHGPGVADVLLRAELLVAVVADPRAAVVVDGAVQRPVRDGEDHHVHGVGVGRPPVVERVEVHMVHVLRQAVVQRLARGPGDEGRPVEGHRHVVRRERPAPQVELARVRVPVHDAVRDGGAQEADQGLRLVPRHGVADEGHVLAAHRREERPGAERRQPAPRRLPPPVQVARVGPPVADAVVAVLHVALRAVVPPRVARRVHPPPLRVVAALRPGCEAIDVSKRQTDHACMEISW